MVKLNASIWRLVMLAIAVSGCSRDIPKPAAVEVVYHNAQFDLTVPLPESWRGYSVVMRTWEEQVASERNGRKLPRESGPEIILRHPKWTVDDPYQDIPILVFTRSQYLTHQGEFAIYAGGIEFELGHNDRYVFAIWSRFNADDSMKGWQEANDIVDRMEASNTGRLIER